MLSILKTAYATLHSNGGRNPKLSLEDFLMATLQHLREYRTYEQIVADFGICESGIILRSHWVEETLIQNGFTIAKGAISSEDTIIIDATEVRIDRPKKTKNKLLWEEKMSHYLSKVRIKIESVFEKVKTFKLFSTQYRNHKKRLNLRFNFIAGICNFEL